MRTPYASVYLLLDPIIKKNPKITISELREEHPEIAKKITYWSFKARISKLTGKKSYGLGKLKKRVVKKILKKRKYVRKTAEATEATDDNIVGAVRKIVPTTRRMKEYVQIGKILATDPNTVYSHLKKAKKIQMCDANFYQFRRKFCALMGPNITAPAVNYIGGNHILRPTSVLVPSKRKTALYTVLYEKESNGYDTKTKDLVTEIFEALQREKIANLEMVELVHPNKVLEIRSYSK